MDTARLIELLDGYLESRLTESDRSQLSAELASSPESCRVFWQVVLQHAQLAELFAETHGRALARQELAEAAPPKRALPAGAGTDLLNKGRSRSARRVRLWLSMTAASILLAVGISWLLPPSPRPDELLSGDEPALANLEELHGDVRVKSDDNLTDARPGQGIRAGQEIRTGEGSFAVLTWNDSSRLELNSNTAVQLLGRLREGSSPAGKRLFLLKGVVNAHVAPQPAGRPMLLSTNQADLMVPGTRFRSASVLDETRIEVESGKALLKSRANPRTFEISTGSYAVADGAGDVIHPAPLLPSNGKPYATLDEGSGPVMGLASAGPDMLAIACWNGIVKLWDLKTRQIRGRLDVGRSRALALSSSRDGRKLAVGYESRNKNESGVVVWNLPRRRPLVELTGARRTHALAFTSNGKTLVFAGGPKGVHVQDSGDRRERIVLGERGDPVLCLAVSPDGRTVAAGCKGGRIRLWDLQTGRLEATLEGHERDVQSLAFHPNGGLLASGSRDGTIRLWSMPTGEAVRILAGVFNEVRCLTFSPDGATLATGHGGTAILWDVLSGRQRSILKAHQFAITALLYLPDGHTLATAGWDRTVKLWDLRPPAL
jgi:WD40 repeat protein/ferric-dicitrate binding protein FerR (iron transport regulator)